MTDSQQDTADVTSSVAAVTLTDNDVASTTIDTKKIISWLKDRYDDFLNRFVQSSDDNSSLAESRLQAFLAIRQKYPQWFEYLDTTDPKMEEILDQGWFLLLPNDDAGRKLYIIRLGLDSTNVEAINWQRALAVFFDYLFLIENKDKTGNVTIADFSGATVESFLKIMPYEDLEIWNEIHSRLYPSQVARVHYINCPADEISAYIKANLEGHEAELKLNETVAELYTEVPMRCLPVEYLPADYTGPNAGTVQQVIENTKAILTSSEIRQHILEISSPEGGVAKDNDSAQSASSA